CLPSGVDTQMAGPGRCLGALPGRVACDRGRKAELVIVGGGDPLVGLQNQIAAAKVEDDVLLAGYQSNPYPFMRTADLYCLSSVYEGMPNALVEAMLCGVPVLSTDCESGPREILQGGKYGRLVPPRDPGRLADAIEDALLHHSTWRGIASEARRHVLQTYSLDAGIVRLMDTFDLAIERFRRRS
ncbi:MAG: glycosyltransferase, partial [Planctomycetes bacterium]|nr:glycosyltransferase [Planctomycetota bacterium]